jgi:hypothetical protein
VVVAIDGTYDTFMVGSDEESDECQENRVTKTGSVVAITNITRKKCCEYFTPQAVGLG